MNFDEWWATLTLQEHRVLGESNARFVWGSAVGECMKVCDEISTEARKAWKAKYDPHDQGRSDGAYECFDAVKELSQRTNNGEPNAS